MLVLDGLLPSVTQSDSSQDQLDSLGASFPLSLSSVFPPLTLPSTASLLTGASLVQNNYATYSIQVSGNIAEIFVKVELIFVFLLIFHKFDISQMHNISFYKYSSNSFAKTKANSALSNEQKFK